MGTQNPKSLWSVGFNAYLRGMFAAVLVHLGVQFGLRAAQEWDAEPASAVTAPQPPSFDQMVAELRARVERGCEDDTTVLALKAVERSSTAKAVRERVRALYASREPCPPLDRAKSSAGSSGP